MLVGCAPPEEVALTMNIQLNATHTMMRRMPWYRDLQRSGLQEDMPEEDRAGWVGRSTRPPNNPPTHEEAFHSLGRAPTVVDLGPHSLGTCSPSLVPYETEEDSYPEEDQDQQRMTPK